MLARYSLSWYASVLYVLASALNTHAGTPVVNTVLVQTGLTVDVTFSEAMGTGVTTASNYTVSGTGQGTLSTHPSSVTLVIGNTYRLTWSSGEMVTGGDVTIAVANVYSATGALIGAPNSGTHSGGGIGIAPAVTKVAYKSNRIIAVTFSEKMGTGATTAANYTLSGSGKGNLAAHPNSVKRWRKNSYKLTWNTGEMYIGGDLTITVTGVMDTAGNLIGNTNSKTAVGAGRGTRPTSLCSTAVTCTGVPLTNITWTAADTLSGISKVELWCKREVDGTWTDTGIYGTGTSGTFSAWTPADGSGTYYIRTRAFDGAGNAETTLSASGDDSFIFDLSVPAVTINQAANQPDTTGASPINFTAVFSEDVTGFTANDVTLGGTAGANRVVVSGGPATYNLAVSGMRNVGTVIATLDAGVATDCAGNANATSTSTDNTVLYDNTVPTIAGTTPTMGAAIKILPSVAVTFSESVTGVVANNLTVNGSAATAVTGGGSGPYTFTGYAATSDGVIFVALAVGAIVSSTTGNPLAGSEPWTYTQDGVVPTVQGVWPERDSQIGDMPFVDVTFSEAVTGVTANSLTVNGSAATNVIGSGAGPYTFSGYPTPADGTMTIVLTAGSIQDVAANAFAGDQWTYFLCLPVAITGDPVDNEVCSSSTVTFTVAASGTAPLSYQWQKNGANLTDGGHFSGATTTTLTVSSIDGADEDTYGCVVSNPCGTDTSVGADLFVDVAPSVIQNPDNQTLCTGETCSLQVVFDGTETLSYQWQKNGSNLNDRGHYSGSDTPILTISGADGTDAADYRCVVTNTCGSMSSNVATLTVNAPPSISQQPGNQSVCGGLTATFAVVVNGAAPLSYQWQKNSVNLTDGGHYSGAITDMLVIADADHNDAADYRCVVTNACGSTTSNTASLATNSAPSITQDPAVQTVCGGLTTTFIVTADGTAPLSYQWQQNDANLTDGGHYSGSTTATLTISDADHVDAANYRCVVTNVCGSAASNASSLTVNAAPTISQQPSGQSVCGGQTTVFAIGADGTSPLSYQWQKDGVNLTDGGHYAGASTTALTISDTGNGHAAGYRCLVTNTCGTATSDAVALTVNSAPSISQHPGNQSVCDGQTITFTVTADGTSPLSYQWQKDNANLTDGGHYSGTTTATLTVSNVEEGDAADYQCVVSNGCGSTNSGAAGLTVNTASSITQNPANQTVVNGQTATFTVTVSGTIPLSYQWQKNSVNLTDGGHYSGATTPALTISDIDRDDITNYRCVVINTCGTATSDAASLIVDFAPSITQHPNTQTVGSGQTATFTVIAEGDAPLSYQWQKNETNITEGGGYSGSLSASLQIANCQLADQGDYRCVVSNAYGSATSNAAALTVSVSAPVVTAALSMMTHGTRGEYGVDVWNGKTECRGNGPTKVVLTFDLPIQLLNGNASVALSDGAVSSLSADGVQLIVYMNGTTNAIKLHITFPGVAHASDATKISASDVCVRVLKGDTNSSGGTNATDLIQVRNAQNTMVDATNFRKDVSVNGAINAADLVLTRNAQNRTVAICP